MNIIMEMAKAESLCDWAEHGKVKVDIDLGNARVEVYAQMEMRANIFDETFRFPENIDSYFVDAVQYMTRLGVPIAVIDDLQEKELLALNLKNSGYDLTVTGTPTEIGKYVFLADEAVNNYLVSKKPLVKN